MADSNLETGNKPAIAILSLAVGDNWNELKRISMQNKNEYAARWGYDVHFATESLDVTRPAAWSKIRLIQKHLPDYDWIFWSDADSFFMNHTISLNSFLGSDTGLKNEDVVIAEDYNGINAGSFFIKNTEWSFFILNHIYQHGPYINHPWWENAAFHYIYYGVVDMIIGSRNFAEKYKCHNRENMAHFKVVPQKLFNSYPDNFSNGDFVIHFPGFSNDERVKMINEEYLERMIK